MNKMEGDIVTKLLELLTPFMPIARVFKFINIDIKYNNNK